MTRLFTICLLFLALDTFAQTPQKIDRPKLVVGLMVDQMRWDFLYRYYERYSSGGFKRLMGEGFRAENTFIPYAQTLTAAGHTCVYTGSVPAINGIVGNEWYDKSQGRDVYCTEDNEVKVVGGAEKAEPQSPRNLLVTTICDELKLATNFKSKVIGVAIKDRGGILPAGHSADAAYWYDSRSGNWVSSTYYMNELPGWTKKFNDRKLVDSFYKKNWNTLYPISTYTQSDADDVAYEGKFGHEQKPVFPHELASQAGKNYGLLPATPYGTSLTFEFAKTALENEGLGKDAVTDFLAVSISSTDYVGHQFGPNSIETEDTYLRLDKDLASFLAYLDNKVGKGQYVIFLTADHAVAHVPGFMEKHKLPGKALASATAELEKTIETKFGIKSAIAGSANYQLYLNDHIIDSAGIDKKALKTFIINQVNKQPGVLMAFDNADITAANLPTEVKEKFLKGYNTQRCGDIQVVLKPGNFYGRSTGTTHGSWYPYDSKIPLVFMGWGIKKGVTYKERFMTDIAPTLASLLHIQPPGGSIGKTIDEAIK